MHLDGYGPTYQGDAERARELLDPGLRELIESGERPHGGGADGGAPPAAAATATRSASFMETIDLLVTPTLPVTAFGAGDDPSDIAGEPTSTYGWLPFTYPFNLTGQPAVTVPAGLAGGLPVGLQIVGRWRDDHAVIAAAAAFERARPWIGRLTEAANRLREASTR